MVQNKKHDLIIVKILKKLFNHIINTDIQRTDHFFIIKNFTYYNKQMFIKFHTNIVVLFH